jgi:hypothetical protein
MEFFVNWTLGRVYEIRCGTIRTTLVQQTVTDLGVKSVCKEGNRYRIYNKYVSIIGSHINKNLIFHQ